MINIFELSKLIFLILLGIILPVLLAVSFFTLIERRLLGSFQRRRGPNVIGLFGILQAIADGLKLIFKESIIPSSADKLLFFLAPIISFFLSILGWGLISYNINAFFIDLQLGLFYILAISALSVYGIIISGWSSNSKYAFLGCLRSTAQMISYEISIGFILLSIILCTTSFNLIEIIKFQTTINLFIPLFPIFILFIISMLAETNRHPFDLPEAEAELVSGYNVEYSAIGFTLFFLAEYANMLFMSFLVSTLFLGGWTFFTYIGYFSELILSIKMCFFIFFFITSRALLPRFRYDQLMTLGWKYFLPLSIFLFLYYATLLYIL